MVECLIENVAGRDRGLRLRSNDCWRGGCSTYQANLTSKWLPPICFWDYLAWSRF